MSYDDDTEQLFAGLDIETCSSERVKESITVSTAEEDTVECASTSVHIKSLKRCIPKRIGRVPTESSELLAGMVTCKGKRLKTEYKRCQFIRLCKKMIREISGLKFSKKFLRGYGVADEENLDLMRKLQEIYLSDKGLFDSLKGTGLDPARKSATRERSFNNSFCREFYSHKSVREFHAVLVDLLFGRSNEVNPKALCQKFNEFCCFRDHTELCKKKWTNVRKYLKTTMFESLGLEPVSTEEVATEEMLTEEVPTLEVSPEEVSTEEVITNDITGEISMNFITDPFMIDEIMVESEVHSATNFCITEDNEEVDVDKYFTF